MVITTSIKNYHQLENIVQQWSKYFKAPIVQRHKKTKKQLVAEYKEVIVVYTNKVEYVNETLKPFFFHPDTAVVKIRQKQQPLLELLPKRSKVLDCTMGMASDAILMSYFQHHVCAIETNPIIYYIVTEGLQNYRSGNQKLDMAMQTITTILDDSHAVLKRLPENSFDVIYIDPMFVKNIEESHNLDGMKSLASYQIIDDEWMALAQRVARKKVIVKAHYLDSVFERFCLVRHRRKTAKFHYGVLEIGEDNEKNPGN